MPSAPTTATPGKEATRVLVALAVGLAAGIGAAFATPWEAAVLIGWDTAVLILLVWIWWQVGRLDAEGTRRVALHEDDSRNATRLLLIVSSVLSLGGVGQALYNSHVASRSGLQIAIFGVGTVAASWALIHTLFMLRYAHLYYSGTPGGIDFSPSHEAPDYGDFAYLAFTVGMTFQVSDTAITSREIRRTVMRQAMLAYVFGVVIVAMTLNVVASLIG